MKKEYIQNNYIGKDKVLKTLGYEENSEEYKKLKQDNEKLLAVIDTMYSEFCRLEDIEDQKVSVEIAFIEEKRDKSWQKKINDKIKEIGSETQYLLNDKGETKQRYAIRKLNELLEE